LTQVTEDVATSQELKSLFDFARGVVLKKQEIADAAELTALRSSLGAADLFTRTARNWIAVLGYKSVSPTPDMLQKDFDLSWVRYDSAGPEPLWADAALGTIWHRPGADWIDLRGNNTRDTVDPAWTPTSIPGAGTWYTSPRDGTVWQAWPLYYDAATGDLTIASSRVGVDLFVEDPPDTVYLPGLGPVITTPQEYVYARFQLANPQGLSNEEISQLQQAVESFDRPGPWTDPREPDFQFDTNGQVIIDQDTGNAAINTRKTTDVAYRGEINDYYRSIIKDYGTDPVSLRTAGQFEPVAWARAPDFTSDQTRRFIATLTESAKLYKIAYYQEAFGSDQEYLNYSRLFVMWMGILRYLNDRMAGFGDIDRMSAYDLNNLLFSFGLFSFSDLPLVYRRRLIKNLEHVLADKGTAKVFERILGIFGFGKDVNIFKYYLVKFFPNDQSTAVFPRQVVIGESLAMTVNGQPIDSPLLSTHDAAVAQLATLASNVPGVEIAEVDPDNNLKIVVRASGTQGLGFVTDVKINATPPGTPQGPFFGSSKIIDFRTIPGQFPTSVTFARATTGMFRNAAGNYQDAAPNVPRFEYDANGGLLGLLIEGASTNLIRQPSLFQDDQWVKVGYSAPSPAFISPEGLLSATEIIPGAGVMDIHEDISVVASTVYTFSQFFKNEDWSLTDMGFAIYDVTHAAYIHQGVFAAGTASAWTRLKYTFTTPVGCTSVRVFPVQWAGGANTGGFLLWHVQCETGPEATSPIKTGDVAQTRAADIVTIPDLPASDWYSPSEATGSIMVEFVLDTDQGPAQLVLEDGANAEAVRLSTTAGEAFQANVRTSSADVATLTAGAAAIGDISRSAVAWANNLVEAYGNGGLVGTDTDTGGAHPTGMVTVHFGKATAAGTVQYRQYLRVFAYWQNALDQAALGVVTASPLTYLGSIDGDATESKTDWSRPDTGFLQADIFAKQAEAFIASRDLSYILDYDQFVEQDPTWEVSKEDVLKQDFSIIQTKYLSVTAALDAVRNGMSMSFFWNVLKDAKVRGRDGTLSVLNAPGGITDVSLFDMMTAMLTLVLWKNDADDIIPHGESGVATIMAARTDGVAFPNEDNLMGFPTELFRVATYPDPLVSQNIAEISDHNIQTSDQVLEAIGAHGREAPPAGYDPLYGNEANTGLARLRKMQQLWTYKFVSSYQSSAFSGFDNYSDYLAVSNRPLYDMLIQADNDGTHEDLLLQLAASVEDTIDIEEFDLSLSVGVADLLLTQVKRLINYFKAYTTDLTDVQAFLLVNDKAQDGVHLMNLLARLDVDLLQDENIPLVDLGLKMGAWKRTELADLVDDIAAELAGLYSPDALNLYHGFNIYPSPVPISFREAPEQVHQDSWMFDVAQKAIADAVMKDRTLTVGDAVVVGLTAIRKQENVNLTWKFSPGIASSTLASGAGVGKGFSDKVFVKAATVRDDHVTVRTYGYAPPGSYPQGIDDVATITVGP